MAESGNQWRSALCAGTVRLPSPAARVHPHGIAILSCEGSEVKPDALETRVAALPRVHTTPDARCATESDGDAAEAAEVASEGREDDLIPLDSMERESEETQGLSPSRAGQKITLEFLSQRGFYDMPMAKAARILGRTEGSFQRICRSLGILRWPYRVRKSLQAIMLKTEQYLDDSSQEDGMSKAEVLRVLQAHMDDIKGISGSGMDKATKQYRQYIFKLNHKLARKAERQGTDPTGIDGAIKAKGMLRAASRTQRRTHPAQIQKAREQGNAAPDAARGKGTQPQKTEGGRSAGPTRPKPRSFIDLPASLAQVTPRQGESVDIMGTMALAACYRRSQSGESTRQQLDEELLRLCGVMDCDLRAIQSDLAVKGPPASRSVPAPDFSAGCALRLLAAGAAPGCFRPAAPLLFRGVGSGSSAWEAL